jgi:glycosyltransferase involved in cell wall biosynthesis
MSTAPSIAPALDRPIRVLQIGNPTGLYGAERWILALITHLPPRQIESWVAVIKDAPDLTAPVCTAAAQRGFRTHVIESYGKLSRSAIGQLRDFIRTHDIDIVHTHGYKTDLIGRLAVRGTPCKAVATPHGWGATPGLRLKLYEALDRVALRFFDAVVPLSRAMFDGLSHFGLRHDRLHLIENGVDLAEIDAAGPVPGDLAMVKAGGALIIGYVGRLDRGKRVDTLIQAMHALPIAKKYLCLVGEGPERPALEQFASRLLEPTQYKFMGFRNDRIALMRGFDVFVLPSMHEGIPRCLMEAMAAGVPAIASDIPGCRELILDRKTGFLFPAGQAVELTRQLHEVLVDPELRERLGRSGQTHIRTHFSAQVMARQYTTLYEVLMRRASPPSLPAREVA